MLSDVRLEEEALVLEGNNVIMNVMEGWAVCMYASDLILDIKARRPGTDPRAYRRALVHDFNDDLTINFAGDYPGGVNINGKVNVPGKLFLNIVEPPVAPPAPSPSSSGLGFHLMTDPFLHLQSHRSPIDLAKEILMLRQLISNLNERVTQLESR